MASTESDVRDSAIGKEEDRSDGVDVLINLTRNTLRVSLI